ncbi:hypothetical protein AAF712_007396 [Marasmius tenuissimus]|uniref:Uncharacterized protein n=1 Tax=Marasmius tenuissimus TaxID=585030 RepID=A0ABR2ZW32_9AGAR
MAQGVEMFEPQTRLTNWKFSISFLLVAVLILTPLFVSLVISLASETGSETSASERRPKRIFTPRFFLNFLPLLIYLYFLSLVPIPSGLTNSDLFSVTLARLIVLGTIILGLLSGVGAIAALEEYLGLFRRNKTEPTTRDIESAERALEKVREDLRGRREEARRAGETPTTSSWMSRVVPKFTGGDDLTLEIRGMEALEYEMSQNLDDLRQRHERAKFASTFRGRLLGVFGKVFAAYCVVRIISSLINLITPHFLLAITKHDRPTQATNYPDLLAKVVGDLLSLASENKVDVEAVGSIMRQISLGLVGLIILNSLRLVLRGVTRALRVTSRSVSASLMLLILAQLMGIYLLSTVVQLRNSFPPPPASSEETEELARNLFSTIPEFQVFGRLFDGSFLLAAGSSGFFRWFRERISSGGSDGV